MKIYIAGRITGNKNAEEDFRTAELWLKNLGHTPLNPMKNTGFDYKDYIDMGLAELSKCEAIYVLDNKWETSGGALLEICYANTVGMKVLHQCRDTHNAAIARFTKRKNVERYIEECIGRCR